MAGIRDEACPTARRTCTLEYNLRWLMRVVVRLGLKAFPYTQLFSRLRRSPLDACKCLIHMTRGVLPIINMANRKPLIYMDFLSYV